jgi:2'-5' RNA ligase
MARVFAAVRLPAELTDGAVAVQRGLNGQLVDVKWVEPENLHLTLRFFGEVDDGAIVRIEEAITEVSRVTTPFTIRLGGVGTFPGRGRPRVIWIGITNGGDRLAAMAAALEQAFVARGLGRGDRAFSPHLTLGRVRDPNQRSRGRGHRRERVPLQATEAMRAAIAGAGYGPADLEVREVALVESHLSPRGPEYRNRHRSPLAAG